MSPDLHTSTAPELHTSKEDRSVSMLAANGYALLLTGPVVAALLAAYVARWGWGRIGAVAEIPAVAMLAAVVGGTLVHEVLHAVAWKLAAGLPWPAIRLGFQWKTFTPYAHARVPMRARAYRIGAATPGVALGLVPALVALANGSGAWLLFGLLFTLGAGGDALILWLLRGVAPGRLVEDHPTRAGCYVRAAN